MHENICPQQKKKNIETWLFYTYRVECRDGWWQGYCDTDYLTRRGLSSDRLTPANFSPGLVLDSVSSDQVLLAGRGRFNEFNHERDSRLQMIVVCVCLCELGAAECFLFSTRESEGRLQTYTRVFFTNSSLKIIKNKTWSHYRLSLPQTDDRLIGFFNARTCCGLASSISYQIKKNQPAAQWTVRFFNLVLTSRTNSSTGFWNHRLIPIGS